MSGGKVAAGGSIQYLLKKDGDIDSVPECYDYMFNNCDKFSEVHMPARMNGVYDVSTPGDTTKTVVYDL